MNDRVRTILEEARKLTPDERRDLLDILESEFAETAAEIESAWLDEVERRAARADRGETTSVDIEEAMARARKHIR